MNIALNKLGSILVFVILLGAGIFISIKYVHQEPDVIVYKSPTCSCCAKWISHLHHSGFKVKTVNVKDLSPIKTKHGINPGIASCHTSLIGNYVVEGHVPIQAIQKLLKEQPNIHGIAVPGMPIGSPGMEGPNPQPYNVYSFNLDGSKHIFMSVD